MHPDIEKIVQSLSTHDVKRHNTVDGKYEFGVLMCKKCDRAMVHRFSVGDNLTRGTCEDEWPNTEADYPDPGGAKLHLFETSR